MLFASRMLLRIPGRTQTLYLNPQLRAFSITRIALEPPKKAIATALPPLLAPAPKRGSKKAPVEPEKPAPRKRLVLSDKARAEANKEKEKERKAKEREKARAAAAKEKERVRAKEAREKARAAKQRAKEREQLQKQREKEKEAKKAEKPYPPPPKRPMTGYLLFATERRREPGSSVAQTAIETSEAWKTVPDSEKQNYSKKFEEAMIKYKSDLAEWLASLNHAQLAVARHNREPGTRGEAALIQLPKRPGNAYALFFKDISNRQDIIDKANAAAEKEGGGDPAKTARLKIGMRGRLAGQEWKSLNDKDKQAYEAKAEELKQAWEKNFGAPISEQKEAYQSATA